MASRYESGDDDNDSFGATRSELQDLKPGVESASSARQPATDDKHRRRPNTEKYQTRTSLADRIRERKAE